MSRAAIPPPTARICAFEVADGVELPFAIPTETVIARTDGWTLFFFAQYPGAAPVETLIGERGVNIYDDHDARELWRRCA